MDEFRIAERLGAISAQIESAHVRLTKIEHDHRADLLALTNKIDDMNGRLNKSSGFASGVLLLSGFVGAALGKVIEVMFSRTS